MSLRFLRCALILLLAAGLAACQKKHDDDAPMADPANPTESFFVFVDGTNGTAAGTGTRQDPLDTIPAGITQAKAEGKAVCIAEGPYAVDSNAGAPLTIDGAVSLYGGYRNTAGAWSRDIATYVTTLGDAAATGGGLSAVACDYGAGAGTPTLDGFALAGATAGTSGTCLRVTNDSSVTLSSCAFVIGATTTGNAVLTGGFVVRATGTITLADCTITGGGGSSVEAINVYRYNLTLTRVTISGLTGTGQLYAVDTGYGAFSVDACDIDAGTSSSAGAWSCGLYINECFPYTVTNSTIRGGNGQNTSHALDIMDTELIGGPCLIQNNLIDAGSGATCYGIELEWAEIFPTIAANTFTGSGATVRYGIYERDDVSEPVAVINNTFASALADSASSHYLYRDMTGVTAHLIDNAAALNIIDEAPQNYNPAGSVYGNIVAP
jgi:hypothetical protein